MSTTPTIGGCSIPKMPNNFQCDLKMIIFQIIFSIQHGDINYFTKKTDLT